jgi:hypothetical protein
MKNTMVPSIGAEEQREIAAGAISAPCANKNQSNDMPRALIGRRAPADAGVSTKLAMDGRPGRKLL